MEKKKALRENEKEMRIYCYILWLERSQHKIVIDQNAFLSILLIKRRKYSFPFVSTYG